MKPPEWLRPELVRMALAEGRTAAEAEAHADEVLARATGVAIWSRAQDKRKPDGTGSIEFSSGASTDPGEIARVARRVAGKAGGAPSGTGQVTFEKLVDAAIEKRGPGGDWPTLATAAEHLGTSERWASKVANRRGGWEAVLAEAARRSG